LIKATGIPIDHYSFEAVELLRDTEARWRTMRQIHDSPAFDPSRDPTLERETRSPSTRIYAIDVSFPQLKDKDEAAYLNNLPTSFSLPPEAVDRLRAAAGKIVLESADFNRLLKEVGARIVDTAGSQH
jgi:NTE family protein